MGERQALVVQGGWDGHAPVETTELFLPFLREHGFDVTVEESLDVYADAARMSDVDLVVQCWSMGSITDEQVGGLAGAVAAGTGLAGWHGGIVCAFNENPAYGQLTGGQFVAHPGGMVDHRVEIRGDRRDHPVVTGVPDVDLHTEQYWVLTDGLVDVLATTTLTPGPEDPWHAPVVSPAVWTRLWGRGRVFVSTPGHSVADLLVPEVRTITERGLLWAARDQGRGPTG